MFSAMATVHDFHLIGYSVDVDARTITLRTEWRYAGQPLRKVDAIFEGVEACSRATGGKRSSSLVAN
jgi:hypothetical protein